MNRAYGEFTEEAVRECRMIFKFMRSLAWWCNTARRLTHCLALTGEKLDTDDTETLEVVQKACKLLCLFKASRMDGIDNCYLTLYALLMEADVSRLDHPSEPLSRYVEVARRRCDPGDVECTRRFLREEQAGLMFDRFETLYKKVVGSLSGWRLDCASRTQYFVTHGTRPPRSTLWDKWTKIDAGHALDRPDVEYLFA